MKVFRILSVVLFLFIGIGACAGGLAAVLNPQSPLGIPLDVLKYSPFRSYLIPGLFLLIVLGLGNIFSFIISRLVDEALGYLSCFTGAVLCLWLIIQCLFMRDIAALHIIFFVFGVIQGLAGLGVLFCKKQFPYYDVIYFIARRRDKRKA